MSTSVLLDPLALSTKESLEINEAMDLFSWSETDLYTVLYESVYFMYAYCSLFIQGQSSLLCKVRKA